ncbi:MAG: EF-hand domain-containing protein [Herbaspirillum sp.]|uniref:EF-hand domain-containing protein n=1 Tax=Herbaspirillum sp. TaxID=1890675 RepID=UPI002585CA2A|nr:EF-hand domain-containing protein [Herbaspirillum sp.]MCP3658123.1 EF-hand domain-containing protein [Herbaspirillum sp.]
MEEEEKEDDGRPRDHRWLFTKLLHLKVKELDKDRSGDIDREEFLRYFVKRLDLPQVIAEAIFDDIDRDKGGDIDTHELLRWKNKHTKPEMLIKYFPPGHLEALERERLEKLKANHQSKHKLDGV